MNRDSVIIFETLVTVNPIGGAGFQPVQPDERGTDKTNIGIKGYEGKAERK